MNRHDVTHNLATAFMNRYDELPQRWHYVNTLGLECFYRVARTLDDKAWLAWVKERYDRFFNSEGIIEEYVLNEFSVDLISAGKLLFDLCGSYGEERYLDQIKAIAHQFTLQMRTPSGGFWHKAIYPQQMWLDGLYMHGPFYIRYGVLTNTVASVLDDLVFQFELMYEKANDSATGLLYHAWDEYRQMRWADPDTGLSANFWSRAMGWYCMALVDVLSFIPPILNGRGIQSASSPLPASWSNRFSMSKMRKPVSGIRFSTKGRGETTTWKARVRRCSSTSSSKWSAKGT